ncbi:MAG: hypothetical protein CSA62_12620 [Planctomycetota bacterium]|nr:MAG: hypothetical protein CSA62_12620 [Planctomycetota bacterium]
MVQLEAILARMNETGASVLHLRNGERVLFRIGHKLVRAGEEQLSIPTLEGMLEEVLRDQQWEEFRAHGELDFLHRCQLGSFRAHLYRYDGGWALTMRRIDQSSPRREQLGLPEDLDDWLGLRSGLVLFTGPIGCGKTTAIHSLVRECNGNSARHVLLLENPIEILHEDLRSCVQQVEIGTHVPSMKQGLELARNLRPDLLVVGDIEDGETALGVLDCVESGILVFASMHAASIREALRDYDRMLHETKGLRTRERFAQALQAGLGQQLLPRQYGSGHVPVLEILIASERVRSQIAAADFAEIPQTMHESRGLGMRTLDQSLLDLVQAKEITPEEARLHASEKGLFEPRVGVAGGL